MRKLAALLLLSFASAQMPEGATAHQPDGPAVPAELQEVWDKYEQLIVDYPDEPLLHYNFGNLAYGTGDYARALKEYKTALNSGDRLAQSRVYYNLGNSLYRAGQLDQARDFFRQALRLNPADADARTNYELASMQAAEQQQQKDTPASDPDAEDEQQESSEDGERREGDQGEGDRDQQEQSDQSGEQDEQQGAGEQPKGRQAQPDPVKKEEAEAILNALKANEDNLLKRQYKTANAVKLEKDW
ncbi:MAG: tetratricopeptide repeat protein [Candidatus Marinimicrobia bacterium]|nr:tetratricopeptide repeat protein [Candidatus Neomarinimicrobiota bacterium]